MTLYDLIEDWERMAANYERMTQEYPGQHDVNKALRIKAATLQWAAKELKNCIKSEDNKLLPRPEIGDYVPARLDQLELAVAVRLKTLEARLERLENLLQVTTQKQLGELLGSVSGAKCKKCNCSQ